MKTLRLLFPAIVISTAFGGPIESDLAKLKSQRELALAKYTAEIDRQYVKELNKLQEKALVAKDLDGAIAVKTELKNYGTASPAGSVPASFSSKEEIKKFLIGHRFGWGRSRVDAKVTFEESGKASTPSNFMTAWKITGNRELTVTGWDGKLLIVYRMDADWRKGVLDPKKTTKKDETVGFIKIDEASGDSKPEVTARVSSDDSNSELFGRRTK